MKFIATAFLSALLAFALGLYFPWWTVALAGAIVSAVLNPKPWQAFLAGMAGVFLLWYLVIYLKSTANSHVLAHRMSLFILKQDSPGMLILVSALVGGLVAGFGALTGSLFRRALPQRQSL